MMRSYTVQADDALCFTEALFAATGLRTEYAHQIADNLVQAEKRGVYSHGLSRVNFYLGKLEQGGFKKDPEMKILSERASAVNIDADWAPGVVAGTFAMEKCMEKARQTGIGMATVGRSNHYGIAAYYSMMALKEDMIGISSCTAVPKVSPHGSKVPLLGTNPISVAIPADKRLPFVFDGATSIVAQGKVMVANKEKRPIPLGWALDKDGNPTTDSAKAVEGSILPLGGYKGSGIAMIIDIISGVLSSGIASRDVRLLVGEYDRAQEVGMCFAAIDVAAFQDPALFKAEMDKYIDVIKSADRAPGFDEILIPGELEFRKAEELSKSGFSVGAGVMAELDACAEKYNLEKLPRK